jgi:hypothetical protein
MGNSITSSFLLRTAGALLLAFTSNLFGATANLVATDQTTQGTWKGIYGADGYNIPHQSGAFPNYATVTFTGAAQWVWNYGTADAAALQKPNGSDRIASCWYAASSFAVEINLNDTQSRRVAMYFLDWDALGRQQTVTVTDAGSGAVLSSQTLSAFTKGTWLVWEVNGRVKITVAAQKGNAVLGGLFFGGTASTVPQTPTPAPAQVAAPSIAPQGGTFSGSVSVTLATATSGAAIRYTVDGSTPGASSPLYSSPFTLTASSTVRARAFASGMTESAVTSATFSRVDPAPEPAAGNSATFVAVDRATQGNWKGAYGGDGLHIPQVGGTFPSYATVSFSGSQNWVWNYNSTDIAAVQKITGSDRVATCWYAASSYSIDINIPDGSTRRVALYCLDWDVAGRQQTVTVSDAATGAQLHTQTLSDFSRGAWLVWDIKGNVTITLRALKGNAVAGGLFFGPGGANIAPVQQVATPVINPPGGSFSGPTTVSISSATADATIRYTLNGTEPTSSSTAYTAPFTPSTTVTVRAKAFKAGMTDSAVASATFTISNPTAPASNLPDLANLPNRVFPAPEAFDTVQYAPNGKLGFIVWRDQQLIFRERSTGGTWSEDVVSNGGGVFKMLTAFTYSGLREDYKFQPAAILLYDSASQAHVFQASGRNISHYVRGSSGWLLTETISASLANADVAVLVGAVGPNNTFHLGALSAGLSRNLTYASNRTGQWTWNVISTVTEAPLSYWAPPYAPRWLSLAVDSRNAAHFAFRNSMTLTYDNASHPRAYSELRYANNTSGQWVTTLVQKPDDITAEAANGMSIAIAPDDRPRIVSWYNDRGEGGSSSNSRMFYHEPNGTGWARTTILSSPDGYVAGDGPKGTGFSPYLRFDASGRPHILFLDHASEHFYNIGQQEYAGNLRHAWRNGSTWSFDTIYRQNAPLAGQIVYPAFAIRGNEMAVTLLQRNTQWKMTSYPPISDSTYLFRFFTKSIQ